MGIASPAAAGGATKINWSRDKNSGAAEGRGRQKGGQGYGPMVKSGGGYGRAA